MVECGYRFRFFGDDAVNASKCLGIYSRMDHSFLVASVPTYRVVYHMKKLINSGYKVCSLYFTIQLSCSQCNNINRILCKVALVRQTETAALRKASKQSSQSSTFSRAVVGIFTSSTMVDDDDPAYSDLIKSKSSAVSAETGTDDDAEDWSGEDGDADESPDDHEPLPEDSDDDGTWLLSVVEKETVSCGGTSCCLLALVAVDVRSHALKHELIEGNCDSQCQQVSDLMDLLLPAEVIVAESVRERIIKIIEEKLTGSARGHNTCGSRTARVCVLEESAFAMPSETLSDSFQQLHPAEQQAICGLKSYLGSFNLTAALDKSMYVTSMDGASDHKVDKGKSFFNLDAHTCKDLDLFRVQTGYEMYGSGSSHSSSGKTGSLFWFLNRCKTSFGRRCLHEWILKPLLNHAEIQQRQNAVLWLHQAGNEFHSSNWKRNLISVLSKLSDSEKVLAALHHNRVSPRRLLGLLQSIQQLTSIKYTGPYEDLPAYIIELLKACTVPSVFEISSKFLGCLNLTSVANDSILDVFSHIYESTEPKIVHLRSELACSEVLSISLQLMKYIIIHFVYIRTIFKKS